MSIFEMTKGRRTETCPLCGTTIAREPFCQRCGFDIRYAREPRQTIGPCAFCSKVGEFSAEHVFNDWIRSKWHREEIRDLSIRRSKDPEPEPGQVTITGSRKVKTAERYGEIVYHTCQTCNGGWMSAVVNSAKPEVIKLVKGDWSLTPDGQGRLSRWIALVTTSISYFCGPAGVSEHHRRCMKEAAHLDGWRIWVAALANADHGGRMRHVAISGGDQQGGQPSTQVVAFTIENVGFLVAHSLGEQTLDLGQYYGLTLPAPAEAGLLPILPPSDAASPATITYSQFLQLVDVVAGVN